DSLEFETTIVTLVNSLDKRLTELSEKFNSKISEIKDSFEEKIKHSSDYAVRLIDDLSGYLDSKLSEINSKVEIAETENYKQDRSSVTHLEESLTNLLERYKELINTISNFDEKLMQVREELDKKISEIKTNNQIMFSVLETKIIEKINEKVSKIDQINSERIKELEKNFTNIKSLNFLDKDTFSENIKFFEERLNNLESSVSRLHQSNEEMDRKIEKILYEKMNMLKTISEKLNTSIQSIESLEEKVSNLNLELEERKNKEFSLRQDFEKSNNLLYNKYDELRFFVNSEIKKISSLIEDIKKERLAEDTATQKEMQEIRLKLLRLVEEVDSLKTQLSNYNEAIYLLKDNFNKDIKNEVSIVGKNVDFLNKEVLNLSEKLKNIEKVEKQINDLNAFKYNLLENTENITRLLLIKESEIYKKIKEESESLLKTLSSLRLQLKETREMVSYMKDDFLQKLGNLEEIIKSFSISDKSNNFAKNIDFGDIIVRIKRMESLEERIDKLHALVEDVDKKIMLINEEMWKDVEIKMRSTIQELDNRISEIEKKLDRFQKENKSILDKEIYELKMLKELMGKFMEESKKELNTLRKGVEEKLYHQNFDEEAILKYLERLKNE
ncbi:MAG: hypothetical protein N3E38_01175, partial [Candidatus Aenigmarchaeota archaeon]|nr:hypothetical protein [Candidatus Aenigmarchaeota archaeon]